MPDTYDRRVQLGASRRRLEDAQVLHTFCSGHAHHQNNGDGALSGWGLRDY